MITQYRVVAHLLATSDTQQGVDPFAMMTNAQNMLFHVISVIGFIWIGLSVFQLAMAFKSEDGTQKAKAFASLAGAVLCAGVGVIVSVISGTTQS